MSSVDIGAVVPMPTLPPLLKQFAAGLASIFITEVPAASRTLIKPPVV